MTTDAINFLEIVRDFLSDKMLPAAPGAMKSDVRACVKGIENALRELDVLYPTLLAECQAMAQVCRQAKEISSEYVELSLVIEATGKLVMNTPAPSASLRELKTHHAAWCDLTGNLALMLQHIDSRTALSSGAAETAVLLDHALRILGQNAQTRSRWQSVFPLDRPFSEMMTVSRKE